MTTEQKVAEIARLKSRRVRTCTDFGARCTAGSGPSPRDAAAFAELLARIDAQVELLENF